MDHLKNRDDEQVSRDGFAHARAVDAMAAVGLSKALDQHPKKSTIKRELMNDNVEDAPRTLKKIADLVRTGTVQFASVQ